MELIHLIFNDWFTAVGTVVIIFVLFYLFFRSRKKHRKKTKKRIYLISDCHFDHANIIRYCERPFINVQEMNRVLIRNWNNVVQPKDTVFYLGDWSFGRGSRPIKYWKRRLNGHVICIKGSHDRKVQGVWFHKKKILHYGGYRFLLLHSPSERTNIKDSWVIHGHKHNNNMRSYPFINGKTKTINVSVELINYRPLSLDYLLTLSIDTIRRMETINSMPKR